MTYQRHTPQRSMSDIPSAEYEAAIGYLQRRRRRRLAELRSARTLTSGDMAEFQTLRVLERAVMG